MIETNWTRSCTKDNRQNRTVSSHCLLQVRVAISVSIVSAPLFLIQFNVDRLQIIVVAKKYIYVSQLLKEARDAITSLAYGYIQYVAIYLYLLYSKPVLMGHFYSREFGLRVQASAAWKVQIATRKEGNLKPLFPQSVTFYSPLRKIDINRGIVDSR